eukprot:CAMPEP_0172492812 /NCGR_PEP_ID=MMETSP1066-20121228/24068_1 /TAXON_ID=671091 /ORGANISM="Coscinodiscus wailesii, Strain CCMP2513" /LENGTH=442 /DNA_ID=CAMNT_0013262629 /DNA_START=110 /DNA_END=1435 /DNA_ORIENTATION=+
MTEPDENDELPEEPRRSAPLPTPVHSTPPPATTERSGPVTITPPSISHLTNKLKTLGPSIFGTPQKTSFVSSFNELHNKSEIRHSLAQLLDVFENVIDEAFALGEAVTYWQRKEEETSDRLERVLEGIRNEKRGNGSDNGEGEKVIVIEDSDGRKAEVEQLKSLVRQLQKQNDDLTAAIRTQSKDFNEKKNELEHEVSQLHQDKKQLKQSLEEMDQRRDALENQLDELTSEINTTTPSPTTTTDDDHNSIELTKQIDELHRALSQREIETNHLRHTLANHKNENTQLHHHLHHLRHELEQSRSDLEAAVRENQHTAAETTRLSTELSTTRVHNAELTTQIETYHRAQRARDVEKDDVLANYRRVCDERSRIELALDDTVRAREALARRYDEARGALRRRDEELSRRDVQLRETDAARAALERDLDGLSRQLLSRERACEAAE